MTDEHAVDDGTLHRIHRAKRHAPWRYSTSLTTSHYFVESRAYELADFLTLATRLGASSVAVAVSEGAATSIESIIRAAHVRNLGVVVSPPEGELDDMATWLDAGAIGINVTSYTDRDWLAGLILATPGRIRTVEVSGPITELARVLADDWIEVTSWTGLEDLAWSADSLIDTLTEAYAAYERAGAVPAWNATRFLDDIPIPAKVLAVLALPGAVTIDLDILQTVPKARRLLRYREQLRLDEESLSWSRSGDLVRLIAGEVSCFINLGGEPATMTLEGRLVARTDEPSEDEHVLAPGSAAWVIHPRR